MKKLIKNLLNKDMKNKGCKNFSVFHKFPVEKNKKIIYHMVKKRKSDTYDKK